MVSKTKAVGQRLEEAKEINKSLLTLGVIVNKLSAVAAAAATANKTADKQIHIPYRDSKLTRLLQNSFGGSAKTFLLVNVSPSHYNARFTATATIRSICRRNRAPHV